MTTLVIDASVAAKWFLPEPDAPAALRLLDGSHRLAAPDLICAEMGNPAWKLHSRGALNKSEALELTEHFLSLPVEIHETGFLLVPVLEIAIATRRTVYDSLYLALAIELDASVVTADERGGNALAGGPFARYMRFLREC